MRKEFAHPPLDLATRYPASSAHGLYDPKRERDACGLGCVVDIRNRKSHENVRDALTILRNLEHRGGVGSDPRASDGAGILVQTPDAFLRAQDLGFVLPAAEGYACGHVFMPQDAERRARLIALAQESLASEDIPLLGWRTPPTDNSVLGHSVASSEPAHRQLFCARPEALSVDAFERKLYAARRRMEKAAAAWNDAEVDAFFHVVSLSARTLCYKGMIMAGALATYYRDLADPLFASALALVHQRFSTNTFPSWRLAHPYRMICHNGEINTVRGNVNWMAARERATRSRLLGADTMKTLFPIIPEGQSDTASFDNALEFLTRGGYDIAHAMAVLIPEAWRENPRMEASRRDFYAYHAALMEPWDGPAAVAFTDGRKFGATLDRNGLRPARWVRTKDDRLILASEAGALPVAEHDIVHKWRLQPGKTLLVDLEAGAIIEDDRLKSDLAEARPWRRWIEASQLSLDDLPRASIAPPTNDATRMQLLKTHGYNQEDMSLLLAPMTETAQEAVGSMGADTPPAALSDTPRLLYDYFKQNFAQVTNPPIDSIREEIVMSLMTIIGPRPNLFGGRTAPRRKMIVASHPILEDAAMARIRALADADEAALTSRTLDATFARPSAKEAEPLAARLRRIQREAEQAVRDGREVLVLSDRLTSASRVPIPALLATAAVHHHLVRKGLRTSVGLVVETAEAREVHHLCCLAGFGAEAINPWLAFQIAESLSPSDPTRGRRAYIKALRKGMLKVMSKMGISTYQSYCGAQIFDTIGISKACIAKYFPGVASMIDGIGLDVIQEETLRRHAGAFALVPGDPEPHTLPHGGMHAWRVRGERHAWTPESVRDLQRAARLNDTNAYQAFANSINDQDQRLLTLRGLMRIRDAQELGNQPIPLDQVEPATTIVRRFATGAMSFGSISREAHTSLAIAMNRIGGKSNTGEGGEEADRFQPMANGDSMRSAIKQVASGRFGVTTEYLANADMIQIKMAQGAKPGEGGQLPGHKVGPIIAKVRHSTPGVGLISPPPHHDIYSIEDLAQLIFDLKNVNPRAAISVKLVSEVGVGTVAAGVSKARADHVTISGGDGGTGASPMTSLRHAGAPWELGLAETHQTLVANNLRGRIAVQVDGGLRTGRDVAIAAMLGADQFGFSTAPLIAVGCLMMRKCHLNTCPVGIATQDPILRKRFHGQPEHVVNYLFHVAEELRGIMAALGLRDVASLIGRVDILDTAHALMTWKSRALDFSALLTPARGGEGVATSHSQTQHHPLEGALDLAWIEQARPAFADGTPITIEGEVANINRCVGTMLSGALAAARGHAGLEPGTITLRLRGCAGQSLGAWLARGVALHLEGETNDYVGKGLSGGLISLRPASDTAMPNPEACVIAGNTALYGAIAGEFYARGVAGERFAVRNSGAIAVVEGVGDHGCEYMTGGVVVVLGPTGRNFAAGMSGGVAYVLDERGDFAERCNLAMVDLEPLPEEDSARERTLHQAGDMETHGSVDVMRDMTTRDAERLATLLREHLRWTGSPRAKAILDNWSSWRGKFRKVMPVDYRRALEQAQAKIGEAGEAR